MAGQHDVSVGVTASVPRGRRAPSLAARRRRVRWSALALAPLIAALPLASCDTGVHGEDTRNGRQLRPSEIPTPPSFISQARGAAAAPAALR
jgi:hypothetical protein